MEVLKCDGWYVELVLCTFCHIFICTGRD